MKDFIELTVLMNRIRLTDKTDKEKCANLLKEINPDDILSMVKSIEEVSSILDPLQVIMNNATPGKWYAKGKKVLSNEQVDAIGQPCGSMVVASTVEGFRHQDIRERDARYIAAVNPHVMTKLMDAVGLPHNQYQEEDTDFLED